MQFRQETPQFLLNFFCSFQNTWHHTSSFLVVFGSWLQYHGLRAGKLYGVNYWKCQPLTCNGCWIWHAPMTAITGTSILGPDSILRCCLTTIGNPIVEIFSTMWFPILASWHLFIFLLNQGPAAISLSQVTAAHFVSARQHVHDCSVPPPNDDRTRTSVFYVYWRTFLRVQHGELQDKTNTNKTLKHATKQSKVITKRSKA